MCGFDMSLIFKVAIFVIVVLVVLALLRAAFGSWFAGITTAPYWNIIQIVIGGVIAICVLLFIWRMAECAGVVGSAHAAEVAPPSVFDAFTDKPCEKMADIAKVGTLVPLSDGQFQFVRALYVALPPMSKTFPPGDHAVIAGGSDGTAMVAIVDGNQTCAMFQAPPFVIQMLNDIKSGKFTHVGKPT
jgi:hypothetical protein